MATFSERLKILRASAGEKQSEVARVVGVSVQSLSSYEMGREPKYDVLCKLALYFDCSVDYLIGFSDCKNDKDMSLCASMQDDFYKALGDYEHSSKVKLLAALSKTVRNICLIRNDETKKNVTNAFDGIILSCSNAISKAFAYWKIKEGDVQPDDNRIISSGLPPNTLEIIASHDFTISGHALVKAATRFNNCLVDFGEDDYEEG